MKTPNLWKQCLSQTICKPYYKPNIIIYIFFYIFWDLYNYEYLSIFVFVFHAHKQGGSFQDFHSSTKASVHPLRYMSLAYLWLESCTRLAHWPYRTCHVKKGWEGDEKKCFPVFTAISVFTAKWWFFTAMVFSRPRVFSLHLLFTLMLFFHGHRCQRPWEHLFVIIPPPRKLQWSRNRVPWL